MFDENGTLPKKEPATPTSAKIKRPEATFDRKAQFIESGSDEEDINSSVAKTKTNIKPKPGRLISNEHPLEDFNRLVEGEGDVFRKAIQDLGAVVKENVNSSFSRSAFPAAIECIRAMRRTALTYEEVEAYNE